MHVLVLGATGNLGSRLLSALLQRGHTVSAFVRDPAKLSSSLTPHLTSIETGDARKATEIKGAVLRTKCDAIVNTAGLAAAAPWGHSDLPAIVDAVIAAALETGRERGSPLRVWLLGGVKFFPEHRGTWAKLQSLPPNSMLWSILCPGEMRPLSPVTYPLASAASAENIVAQASTPPAWTGRFHQVVGYATKLEHCADFIAGDLAEGAGSQWVGRKVGVRAR
ncbi:hypothetical protein BO71DRAFT_453240 [Aspergillus ellipticus CBS 707.79]|uniref:NAD(P)-binding domain-containing protein n=1 Tax=Aspergillus ellipticus CBS 707.79 TaxID=1448320 RepID=A0A319CXB6_9EURO|nr:hypothetical protein BO71DRAFT_453240 [Aspergillus ellipticus CBS 707.79]